MTSYKDAITEAMTELAKDPQVVFIGYNIATGSKANGTLANVSPSQLIEIPVAENLGVGLGIGMAIAGFKPIVYIERCDFLMNAMDAIVNHLDKIAQLSNGEFEPKVTIRTVVGSRHYPLFSGPTHTQDFSEALKHMVRFPVIQLNDDPRKTYSLLNAFDSSAIVVEYRDLYSIYVDQRKPD